MNKQSAIRQHCKQYVDTLRFIDPEARDEGRETGESEVAEDEYGASPATLSISASEQELTEFGFAQVFQVMIRLFISWSVIYGKKPYRASHHMISRKRRRDFHH